MQPSWQTMKYSVLNLTIKVIIDIIILRKRMECCSETYTHENFGDSAFLPQDEDIQPIFREEVEIAVEVPKNEKSAGIDNIPAGFVETCG